MEFVSWEGWHPIYEMEPKKMFETTNQQLTIFAGITHKNNCLYNGILMEICEH